MSGYIERQKVYEMLNSIGGCGAEPESWADGWDKAIDEAIRQLEKIPAACNQEFKCKDGIIFNYCPNRGAKIDGGKHETD